MSYINDLAVAIYREAEGPDDMPLNLAPLYLGYAVLALAKGPAVTAEDVHDAWAAWASEAYDDQHRSLVPFGQLTPAVQALDEPYVDAIRRVAAVFRAALAATAPPDHGSSQ